MKERVIFGATSKVGAAVARMWAVQKDRITIVGRSGDRLAILAKDLQARGAESVEICIMNFNDLEGLWADVVELFRDKKRVDTLLVCQGVASAGLEMKPEIKKLKNLWEVNFESVATILLAAKSHFVQNCSGTMATMTGIEGERGRKENYVFGSSKAALICFMSGLRQEVSPFGVKACTIVPGPNSESVTKEMMASDIVLRLEKENILYLPKSLGFLACLARLLPESLFYRLKIW